MNTKTKKGLAILLVFAMLCSILPAGAVWAEGEDTAVESSINATEMSSTELKTAVANAVAEGHTTLDIKMAANADVEMFNAICAALYETLVAGNVARGSIDLTLNGVTKVPANAFYYGDEDGYFYWPESLKSVTLPAVTEIGNYAFSCCYYMTSVTAPKAEKIGIQAFYGTLIKEVNMPEVTEIEREAFLGCGWLETVYLPKVATIGYYAFANCLDLEKVTFGALESVQMSTNGNGIFYNEITDTDIAGNIDLTLACGQKAMTYDSSTKYWSATEDAFAGGTDFIGYTFKSITPYILTYIDNGDGSTHTKKHACCDKVVDASEAHTPVYTVSEDGASATITLSCSVCESELGTATISADSKVYDGEAVVVNVEKAGILANTDIPVSYTKDGKAFTGESVNAGSYTASITLGGQTARVEYEVAKVWLNITANSHTVKTGSAVPDLTNAYTVDGLLGDDTVSNVVLRYGLTQDEQEPNMSEAGYYTIEIDENSLFVTNSDNYYINCVSGDLKIVECIHDFTEYYIGKYYVEGDSIFAKCKNGCNAFGNGGVIITIVAPEDAVYEEGMGYPASLYGYTDDILVDSEDIKYSAEPVNAGTYTASITYKDLTASVTYEVAKRALTITADNQIVYVGDSVPEYTYTVTGWGENYDAEDEYAHKLSGIEAVCSNTDFSQPGTYNITISGTPVVTDYGLEDVTDVTDNYTFKFVNGTLTVKAASGSSSSGGDYSYSYDYSYDYDTTDATVSTTDDSVTVTADSITTSTLNDAKEAVAEDDSATIIGGKDSAVEVTAKENGSTVSSFSEPVTVTVPVSTSALKNVEDTSKLTLALVETDANGDTTLTYIGGNYDAKTGTFTAYAAKPGNYVLVEKSDIIKIELTIGSRIAKVNGTPVVKDTHSRIIDSRTVVPVRFVAEQLGANVDWNADTRTVTLTVDGQVITLPVDSIIPGYGTSAVIHDGRTLVPVRYIAEALGAHVVWVEDLQKVVIVK